MYILDCTLRDGGYYNNWDFPQSLVQEYLNAMSAAGVDIVELGLRSGINDSFKGACAYTTDSYINQFVIPESLKVAVMINASELVKLPDATVLLQQLFPFPAGQSPVDLVRIACHVHEFKAALPACHWLKERGFMVGFNLMQVADRTRQEVEDLAKQAAAYPIDALYFADSMGSMDPAQARQIVGWLKQYWHGALGIHTHDNMGMALQNTLAAVAEGVSWLDSTVTGMGRGPGNARTEELVIEVSDKRGSAVNMVPLMKLIRSFFQPLKNACGWGSNPYYYLSGKYGIHPTYIQEMMGDSRYSEEDILAAINQLKVEGGKKFSFSSLANSRHFYSGSTAGQWLPEQKFFGREVLLLGTGAGVEQHRFALEQYIRQNKPLVLALNTQSAVAQELIDLRLACHPVRMLADCSAYEHLPQPLITPVSMLPEDIKTALGQKELLDFGIAIKTDTFEFQPNYAVLPTSLVICYALAVATSGKAKNVFMAGFDGYPSDDPRNSEMNKILQAYHSNPDHLPLISVTPSRYELATKSIYGLI